MSASRRLMASTVFLSTVFLSAFLLFQVQPLISKYILPWFGGSPGVWTTCMLFFQVALFCGYLYAHLLVDKLSVKKQVALHLTLMGAVLCLLPIVPDIGWKPADGENPSGRIMLLLAATVGLPYFVLSTTGPLLQGWYARVLPGTSPYRLYALSNAGSLLALLSYPFVFEPLIAAQQQAYLWSYGFGAFALLCVGCAVTLVSSGNLLSVSPDMTPLGLPQGLDGFCASPESIAIPSSAEAVEPLGQAQGRKMDTHSRPSGGLIALWIALAAVPSAMLLAITSQVCTDIAVVPFLWIVPLALYLLTFILCFDSDRWYKRSVFGTGLILTAAGACLMLWDSALYWLLIPSISAQASIFFGLLFCGCMVCHGELVALKPHARFLTLFYLCLSAGGAIGGVSVGLLAPMIFTSLFELPLVVVASCSLLLIVMARSAQANPERQYSNARFVVLGVFVVTLAGLLIAQSVRVNRGALASSRNFYGVLHVYATNSAHVLRHGQIRHGHQFLDSKKRRIATTYYGVHSGGGLALAQHRGDHAQRVGIVGLGAGTLAAYAQAGDYYRMYEINPAVVTMANDYFTYLSECRGKCDVVVGDGRIALENEEPQNYDVLVLDAFSGDAVPAHLLTRECGELYLKHLCDDGLLACHITNRHVNLIPVCAGLASEFGLSTKTIYGPPDKASGTTPSVWVLMSRKPEYLAAIKLTQSREISMGDHSLLWTDDFSNLLSVLQSKGTSVEFVDEKKPKVAAN